MIGFRFAVCRPEVLFFFEPVPCPEYVIAVQDGGIMLSWRGDTFEWKHNLGWSMYRWSEVGPYWVKCMAGCMALVVVDDFGEMVEVMEYDR